MPPVRPGTSFTNVAMNHFTMTPLKGPLDAKVRVPGSKSLTNRAMVTAALARGTSTLRHVLFADDTVRMMDALRALGFAVRADETAAQAVITGGGGHIPATDAHIDCAAAGTVMRFGAALCALGDGRYRLDGVARMRERPVAELVDALRLLGALVEYEGRDGYPPVIVHARGLAGGTVDFDSPPSSQMVSAILLAAPAARSDVMVEIAGELVSKPYVQMTLAVLRAFGAEVIEADGRRFIVPAPQPLKSTEYVIEPDASNASYFLAAPAIAGGRVTVEGLGTNSVQGDARFVDVLERMGCVVTREPTRLTVHGPPDGARLRGIDVDLNDMPDMVQTLAVAALFAEGPTTIRNVANLRLKETDRLAAVATELRRVGAEVDELADGLVMTPPAQIRPATIQTYEDHRMAMSFALLTLAAPGVEIADPSCVGKTFPDFFDRFMAMCGRT